MLTSMQNINLRSQPCYFNPNVYAFLCLLYNLFLQRNAKPVFALFFPNQDGKTALYWAVEKGNATMVRDLLQCNPDTESCTKV